MILVKSVIKKFRQKTAINNISFTAKEGDIVGFLGPNGAGKTTTMRLLLGYILPTAGKIVVNNLRPEGDRIKILKNVGYLSENNPLYDDLRVIEYLQFIAAVKSVGDFSDLLTEVGLEDVLPTKIEELSRGFKQRVGLAAALIGDPAILILDEPTSGLDPLEQEKIRDLIKKLARRKTIIFSTHILSEVENIATKLIIINRGKIVYDGVKPKGRGMVEKLFKKYVKPV